MKPACVSTCVLSVLAALMLLLGTWSVHLYWRFTPVYQEIICELKPARLARGSGFVDGQWRVQLVTTTVCQNPNSYSVMLQSTGDGKIYLGTERRPVASLVSIPETRLEAKGNGTITATVDVPMKGMLDLQGIFAGVGMLFGELFPIYWHNSMEVVIDVNFLFGHFKMTRAFDKDCGMNVQLHRFHPAMGRMVCAKDFDSLPPLPAPAEGKPDQEHGHPSIHLAARGLAKQEVEKGEHAKNLGLHTAMAVFFGLGFILLVAAVVNIARLMKARRNLVESAPAPGVSNQPSAPHPDDLPRVLGARTLFRSGEKAATPKADTIV